MKQLRVRRWSHAADVLLCVVGLLVAAPAASGQAVTEHRASADIVYASRSVLGRGVTHAELTSGLTVLVQENHAAPVATVRCFVRNTGSDYEGRYLGMGVSHLLEHLVALGSTEKRTEKEIQALLDSMGGQTNAFTTTDMTGYFIDCPANRVDLAIELLADSMQYSTIPEDEYRRELEVVQRELEMGQVERGRVLYESMKSLIFTEHPMRLPTIGHLPVVQSATRQDVLAFYKNRYVPQNLVFVVVGDVSTDAVLEQVLKQFQRFQRTTERGVVLPIEPAQASSRSAQLTMPGRTTNFSLAWPTVPLQHPDLYPLDVASYLLTNGDSSRLGSKLRIQEPLALSVSSASYTPGFVPGWFSISLQCVPDKLPRCREVISAEIERLQRELVSDQELRKVKRQKAADHVFGLQTVQQQADALGQSFISTGDPLFDDRYVAGIQTVTAEQIQEVARKYFRPERTNQVTIDPPGVRRESVSEAAELAESPVLRKQLDNGLTLLIKRTGITPTISIQAFVKAGVLADTPATSGRAALATALMTRGTKRFSGTEIAEYFDSIGGSIDTSSQRNTSFLQCSILKEDFDETLQRVQQVLFEPTFPEEEFVKLQQQQLAAIAARQDQPQTLSIDFWMSLLPQDSPYRYPIQGSAAAVEKLTPDACRQFHRSYFVPNNMVLAIFGDLDPEQVSAAVEKLFGSIPRASQFRFPTFPATHADAKGRRESIPIDQPETAMTLIGYPTVSVYQHETRASLEVLDAILTGLGGRLFTELRGQGLVYYVFGQEMTGMAPGYFLFMAQTRPETADEVIQRIRAAVKRIAEEGVPAEEFARTKQKLVAAHAQKSTTPSAQAFEAAVNELYGLGYDFDRGYDQRIEKVTVESVQQLIKTFFQDPIVAELKGK